jgi:CTP:molybdopterin cytidylyltransferase MocA
MRVASLTVITPIILAAGDSKRMGYPKALLPMDSGTFLTSILAKLRAAGMGTPVVVLGRSASEIQSRVDLGGVETLINRNPDRGQLSSMQMALRVLSPECAGAMLWPVDQPLVSVRLIEDLARLFFVSGALIANPVFHGRRGHPVIFRKDLFSEFLATPPHEGAKRLMHGYPHATASLETEESGTVLDIDTPEDYEKATGIHLSSSLKK